MPAVQRGKFAELNVEKFADGGMSVAHVDEVPVHVKDAVPGDRVKAYIYDTSSTRAEIDTERSSTQISRSACTSPATFTRCSTCRSATCTPSSARGSSTASASS